MLVLPMYAVSTSSLTNLEINDCLAMLMVGIYEFSLPPL